QGVVPASTRQKQRNVYRVSATTIWRVGPSSRGPLPPNLTLFSCFLDLPISLSMYLLLTASQHVFGRDVANGTVQANDVVQLRDQTPIKLRYGKSTIAG